MPKFVAGRVHTSVTWEGGKRGVHGVTSDWEIILGHRFGLYRIHTGSAGWVGKGINRT